MSYKKILLGCNKNSCTFVVLFNYSFIKFNTMEQLKNIFDTILSIWANTTITNADGKPYQSAEDIVTALQSNTPVLFSDDNLGNAPLSLPAQPLVIDFDTVYNYENESEDYATAYDQHAEAVLMQLGL